MFKAPFVMLAFFGSLIFSVNTWASAHWDLVCTGDNMEIKLQRQVNSSILSKVWMTAPEFVEKELSFSGPFKLKKDTSNPGFMTYEINEHVEMKFTGSDKVYTYRGGIEISYNPADDSAIVTIYEALGINFSTRYFVDCTRQ